MRRAILILYLWFGLFGPGPQLHLSGGFVVRLLTVLALMFVVILVHELGHALAVQRLGGRISAIAVMPFRLQMKPRRLKIAMPSSGGDIGGYVSYTLDTIDPRRKHGLIAAAGPAANLLLAAAAALIAMWLSGPPTTVTTVAFDPGMASDARLPSDAEAWRRLYQQQWINIANALAWLSFTTALFNLIPFRGSDGDHILYALSARYRRTRSG